MLQASHNRRGKTLDSLLKSLSSRIPSHALRPWAGINAEAEFSMESQKADEAPIPVVSL